MTVYVDGANLPFGRMRMSHMMADTTSELLEMADRIGMDRNWIQYPGTPKEHFDVAKGRREIALKLGAVEVTAEFIVELMRKKREKRS